MSRKHISSPSSEPICIYDGKNLFVSNTSRRNLLIEDENIIQIACGMNHVLILKINGEIWCYGYNQNGQIGFEDLEDRTKFELLLKDKSIVGIRCGNCHSIFWKSNGDVYGCGWNGHGELGIGGEQKSKIKFLFDKSGIIDIQCGNAHTFILTEDELIGFGSNLFGQLGTGDFDDKLEPTTIFSGKEAKQIKSIHCGGFHSAILKFDGTLLVCGSNYYHQLGLRGMHKIIKFTKLICDPQIESISLGRECSSFQKQNGEIFVFGRNKYNQFGFNSDKREISKPRLLAKRGKIHCLNHYVLICKNGEEICGYGDELDVNLFLDHINKKKTTIDILGSGYSILNLFWRIDKHDQFPKHFKDSIFAFICCLRRLKFETRINAFLPPKFIIWEIMKNFGRYDF